MDHKIIKQAETAPASSSSVCSSIVTRYLSIECFTISLQLQPRILTAIAVNEILRMNLLI